MRRITIVLPHFYDAPIGGYKVLFQYANALARDGSTVTILHPSTSESHPSFRETLIAARARARQSIGRPLIPWFRFHPKIQHELIATLSGSRLPDADLTVLTGWSTAERTVRPIRRAGVLVQIVYDYEFWMNDPDIRPRISAAIKRSDVTHISTSQAVTCMLREIGTEPFATICAGLEDDEFGVDLAVETRPQVVGFPLRPEPAKDMATMFAAASLIKQWIPEALITCFGSQALRVPQGIVSLGRLSQIELREFYNRCAVFVLSSRYEGWGLPALEAMACGASVVSTRNGGTEDFVYDGLNGRLVPTGDPKILGRTVCDLLVDTGQRSLFGRAGPDTASAMTVSASVLKLKEAFQQVLSEQPR